MVLDELLGQTIVGFRRLIYLVGGTVYGEAGGCEVSFSSTGAVFFDCGGDGERLVASAGTWHDPFVEPLTLENRVWVNEAGRWHASCKTDTLPYRRFVRRKVDKIDQID